MTSVFQEILTWSAGRPEWQRDALRRLLALSTLTPEDLDALLRLCKQPYGLLADGEEATSAVVLAAGHLPAAVPEGASVSLTAVEETSNVNALVQGQRLKFAPAGLTIVYGDNAAGKSGYARILKAACRARGAADTILPNVTSSTPTGTPSASICWREGVEEKKVTWRSGSPPPTDLSKVSIFDSKSAAAYVSQKNDVAYRPLGLDLFDRLAEACDQLRRRLDGERREVERSALDLSNVPRDTNAGKFVERLTGMTEDSELQALLLSTEEADELRTLQAQQAELASANPAARVAQLRQKVKRAEGLRQFIAAAAQRLGPEGVRDLSTVRDRLVTTEKAVALSTAQVRSEPLPKVGEPAWRSLWEAAAKYAAEAVPGSVFPDVDDGARCVLCQGTLDETARSRLGRFNDFVQAEASKAAEAARRAHQDAFKLIEKLSFDHASILDALADLADSECASTIADWLAHAKSTRAAILDAAADPEGHLPSPVGPLDLVGLDAVIGNWTAALKGLEASAVNVDARKVVEASVKELSARAVLGERQGDIRAEIGRRRRLAHYDQCRRDCDTAMITRKSTELTQQYVSEQLKTAFTAECERLRFRTVEVELKPAGGQRGSLYHQVRLRHTASVDLPDVLSEGESRCLSIAAFFAELDLVQPKSGMVFDDPVSSLDHHWRESVADRLVAEAEKRQVVVFTHDVFFLFLLQKFALSRNVPVFHQHLSRGADGAGICTDTLPWGAMKTSQRIGALKDAWQKVDVLERKATKAEYEKEAANIYGLLREAWERAIEEVLLNDVVGRFRLSVETKKAAALHDITKDELEQMEAAMSKCSTWLPGHDHAAGLGLAMPSAKDLQTDIAGLEQWVHAIRCRRRPGSEAE